MNRFVSMQVACASCGRIKGDSNHWFVLSCPSAKQARCAAEELNTSSQGFAQVLAGYWGGEPLYVVLPLNAERADRLQDRHYPACGESCLQKMEGVLLSGKTLS